MWKPRNTENPLQLQKCLRTFVERYVGKKKITFGLFDLIVLLCTPTSDFWSKKNIFKKSFLFSLKKTKHFLALLIYIVRKMFFFTV